MKTELKRRLREQLVLLQPQIKKSFLYDKCVNKYVDGMLMAIRDAWASNIKGWNLQVGDFAFPKHKVSLNIGRVGKPQQYIYHVMSEHEETSILTEIHNGFCYPSSSQLSAMRINPIYKELVMEEIFNLKFEANKKTMGDIEQNYTHRVSVDVASLRNFISACEQTIEDNNNKGDAYIVKVLRNLAAAQQLMTMVREADDSNPNSPYVRERYKTDDCGRIYGEGYSLQRMTKEVRHAALGVCHQYDFKACAFAVMAGLAHKIDPSLKIGGVLDYVRLRAKIRERIAKEVNMNSNVIKSIFNAIGFGAKLRNTQFSAIRGELAKQARMAHDKNIWLDKDVWSKLGNDEYERLLANQTFIGIYNEFQQINATIINYFSERELEINGFVYCDIDYKSKKLDKNGDKKKKTDAKKLAWIYQALETVAREQFEQLSGQKALLTTHDCIYFKQKLPVSLKHDILYQLQQTFPYLEFEHTPIFPITTQQGYDSRYAEQDKYERQHKEWIKEQELIAANTDMPNDWCEAFLKPQDVKSEYEYETKRREQFLRDVGYSVIKIGNTTIISDDRNVDGDEDDDYWETNTEGQYWRETVVD